MRLRLVLLDGLDVPIDDVAGVGDRQLREEKIEFLLVRSGETRLDVGREIPEALLEWAERFLAGLVEELFVGVGGLSLVLRVLSEPVVDLVAEGLRDVVEQHRLEVGRKMYFG